MSKVGHAPGNEPAVRDGYRLDHSLHDLGLLDAPPEPAFEAITRLATRAFGAPVALISIIDEAGDRQFFKSQQGLAAPWARARQTPLSHSFCRYVKMSDQPLAVPLSTQHPLVRDNPAIEALNVVSYLGVPIHDTRSNPLGALCVIDSQERHWNEADVGLLKELAICVSDEIALRATLKANALLIARLEENNARMSRYNALRESITHAFMAPDLTAEQRFHALLSAGCLALRADHGAIARVAEASAQIVFAVDAGGTELTPPPLKSGAALFPQVAAGQSIAACADLAASAHAGRRNLFNRVPGAFISAPIALGGQLYGVLEFSRDAPRTEPWSDEALSMISIMAMFASAHLALYRQIDALKRSETALLDHLLEAKTLAC